MKSTKRFSNRVEDYIRYRPGYPAAVIDFLSSELQLRSTDVIADIGSGTGISSELFLRHGNTVWGIEPNREMREAAERLLSHYPDFVSADGTAEQLPMEDHSADMIIAGQAFHWFDPHNSRKEFRRVLKPGKYVVLMWNDRKTEADEFLKEYEALLNTLEDYRNVNHKNIEEETFRRFFDSGNYSMHVVPNHQDFDWEGLYGRLMSSSYVPVQDDPLHKPFMKKMKEVFDKHNRDGAVRIEYDTRLICGKLGQ